VEWFSRSESLNLEIKQDYAEQANFVLTALAKRRGTLHEFFAKLDSLSYSEQEILFAQHPISLVADLIEEKDVPLDWWVEFDKRYPGADLCADSNLTTSDQSVIRILDIIQPMEMRRIANDEENVTLEASNFNLEDRAIGRERDFNFSREKISQASRVRRWILRKPWSKFTSSFEPDWVVLVASMIGLAMLLLFLPLAEKQLAIGSESPPDVQIEWVPDGGDNTP
jgi:hypothetical protein